MNNLLSNAFKYTPDKGEINVHLYREDDNVCICVADNGQGIIDKDKKHIFERFYQCNKLRKNRQWNQAAYCKRVCTSHKGTISVTDNFPKGSVFTVKLPIVTYASEKEELLPELLNNDKAPNELPVPNAEELRYTILLVDDNKDFCSFMSEYLSDEYAIQVAYNGAEALKILEKKQCQYCNKRHHDASDEWNRAMSANQNKHAMVPHSRYIAYSPYGRRIQK